MDLIPVKADVLIRKDIHNEKIWGRGFLCLSGDGRLLSWTDAKEKPGFFNARERTTDFTIYAPTIKSISFETDSSTSFTEQGTLYFEFHNRIPVLGLERNGLYFTGIKKNDFETCRTWVYLISEFNGDHELEAYTIEAFEELILRDFKGSAQVDLNRLPDYYVMEFEYFNAVENRGLIPQKYDENDDFITVFVKKLIAEGRLNGIIDEEKRIYYDRSSVPQKERVINLKVDFNDLFELLEKKGVTVNTVKCPNCGEPCKLPKTGKLFTCDYCGSILKAENILDLFKQFL